MLTGLDFPRELLYGQGGTWLRDDRAGSARLGFHFFTLERDEREVVHVQLPRMGESFERGEEIGHLDLDGQTVPIVAPVGGTVFCPNPDLRAEPDRVRRDAFGSGYLLDLEDIVPDELDDLLGADEAMAHFSQLDVGDGAPSARARIEPDRPWWTTLEYSYPALAGGERQVLCHAHLLPPLSHETFVPDWQIGDGWVVKTASAGSVRRFEYTYLGETVLAGERVHRIRATEQLGEQLTEDGVSPETPPVWRVLYYRVASFTLLAYDIVPSESPTTFRRHWNDRGEGAYMRFGPEDGFFYDHGFIPPGQTDFTRELPATPKQPAILDHYRFRGGGFRVEVEQRARLLNEVGVEERWFTQQIWIAGRPWWTEAVRMRGDKVLVKASLEMERES